MTNKTSSWKNIFHRYVKIVHNIPTHNLIKTIILSIIIGIIHVIAYITLISIFSIIFLIPQLFIKYINSHCILFYRVFNNHIFRIHLYPILYINKKQHKQ